MSKCVSTATNGINLSKQISQSLSKVSSDFEIPATLQECQAKLRQTKIEVHQLVAQRNAHRTKERHDTIKKSSASTMKADKQKARVLCRLCKAEDIKKPYKKIKDVRERQTLCRVRRIEIPVHLNDRKRKRELIIRVVTMSRPAGHNCVPHPSGYPQEYVYLW